MESLFAFKPLDRQTVTVDGHAEAVTAEMVSGNYYSSLEVWPQLGRGIQESDDGPPGSGPVVVISDRFWTREFARSPHVIGKTILFNMTPMTIIGVNPPGFTGAYSAQETPDVFFPFSMQPIAAPMKFGGSTSSSLLTDTNLWWVLVMGRIKPGLPDRTAAASFNVLLDAAVRATMVVKNDRQTPRMLTMDGSRGQNPSAEGLAETDQRAAGPGRTCALAGLCQPGESVAGTGQRAAAGDERAARPGSRALAHPAADDDREPAAVTPRRSFGLALAYAVRNAIPRIMSNSWGPPPFSARFDWRIFGFAAGISIVTGLIFGLAPAWQATRVQVSSSLKEAAQTASRRQRGLAGKTIVVVELALSMLLVVGAGLFVQTLLRLGHSRLGFHPDHLLLFELQPPQTHYPGPANIPLYRLLDQRLAAIPGIRSVALTSESLISRECDGAYVYS